MADSNGSAGDGAAASPSDHSLENLDFRVRRLEDAVANLQDTRPMEDRVAERVSVRLARLQAPATRDPAPLIVEAARRLLPSVTVEAIRTNAPPQDASPVNPPSGTSRWFVLDAYYEGLAMVRMYLDPNYRMAWKARFVPLILLALILTSWLWLPGSFVLDKISSNIATIYVKFVDLVLAFFLYKFLSREARRFLQYEASRYRHS
jgi:hypothetical protein